MKAAAEQEQTVVTVLLSRWEQVSRKIEQLAQEFPEKKFEWRPQDSIRTCGDVLRHVAFWNQYVADSLCGKQADDSLNELPAASYATKAKVLEALQQSAESVAAALREQRGSSESKAAEVVLPFLEHTSEHYGQLVVYARLLDIVPPASRS